MKESVRPRPSIEVRLKETDLKKHGHTRCHLCVEVKGSVEVKRSVKVKGSVEVKGKRSAALKHSEAWG